MNYTEYVIMDKVMEAECAGKEVQRVFIHPRDLEGMLLASNRWEHLQTLKNERCIYVFEVRVVPNPKIPLGTLLLITRTPAKIHCQLWPPVRIQDQLDIKV